MGGCAGDGKVLSRNMDLPGDIPDPVIDNPPDSGDRHDDGDDHGDDGGDDTSPIAPATSITPAPISQVGSAALKAKGEEIYKKTDGGTGCFSCHGDTGKSIPGRTPDIRGESTGEITQALNIDVMSFINLTEEDIEAVA